MGMKVKKQRKKISHVVIALLLILTLLLTCLVCLSLWEFVAPMITGLTVAL